MMGLLSPLLLHPEVLRAEGDNESASNAFPTAGQNYWTSLYQGASSRGRGVFKVPSDDRTPRFLHYNEKRGLRWVDDIQEEELPDFDEDAVVTMEIGGFRAGSKDDSRLSKVSYAQLHLSCQRVTGSEFVGPLVWAAMATVFADKAAKLPSVDKINSAAASLDPSSQITKGAPQLNHVLLSHGAGHLSVNVSTTPKTSLLDKILSTTITAAKIITPIFGFPAISLPALQAFYSFYGSLEKATAENFLLNTSLKDVAVTRKGAESSHVSASAIKFLAGDYILVPKSHEEDFNKDHDKLIVQNGYVIERESVGKLSPDDRVSQAIPSVSYVTLHVKVEPLSVYSSAKAAVDSVLQPSSESDASEAGNDKSSSSKGKSKGSKK
jgi:hypothetical protein